MKVIIISLIFGSLPIVVRILQWLDLIFDASVGELWSSFDERNVYDFIIVGAGSAGSLLANRLSRNFNVLLLEAGGNANILTSIPGMAMLMVHQDGIDYGYKTVQQNKSCLSLEESVSLWPRGQALGGSSILNYMLYVRGNKKDYDNWANITGDSQWSYDNVLPYFMKSEQYTGKQNSAYHSKQGELYVSEPDNTPLYQSFLNAGKELGFDPIDFNAEKQIGFGISQFTQKDGVRWSTNKAFLDPIAVRRNLHILPYSKVDKVYLDKQNRAYGVSFRRHGKKRFAKVSKEVILSAGSIDSPKILMLSGIGPSGHLKEKKIKVKADLPVGKNLMDHPASLCGPVLINKTWSFIPERDLDISKYYDYFANGKGPLTKPSGLQAMAFFESPLVKSRNESWPDLQMLFLELGIYSLIPKDLSRMGGVPYKYLENSYGKYIGHDSVFFLTTLVRPKSRGEILLKDSNPDSPPLINPNYFDHEDDLNALVYGMSMCKKIFKDTKAFQELGARFLPIKPVHCEQHEFHSKDIFECYIKHYTATLYHPAGTAKMGNPNDPTSVVDTNLRVLKTKNLRVIDASIMPVLVNANTNAPAIMIAEKGADIIRSYWSEQFRISTTEAYLLYSENVKCYYSRMV